MDADVACCLDLSAAAHERAGLGRYATALGEALLARGVELSAFVNDRAGSHLSPPLSELPLHTAGLPRARWRLRAAASYFGGPSMDRAFEGVRLFHATAHLLPRLTRARSVFTLHDVAYLRFPQHHLPKNRIYLRAMMPRFVRRADAVIAVSEATRRDALRFYRLDPAKIHVIPEGVDPRFTPDPDPERVATVRDRYELPERFVLYVGTIEPRKNLTTLLEAYAELLRRRPEVGLVIAGGKGWLYEPFFERLRALGLERRVTLTGHVPDEDVPALMSAADVFAFPSEFEGFGLPPLEAMACGVPVVSSDAASLPEVVGDAGVLVPPHDVGAWVSALDRLLDDASLRDRLRAEGIARARTFTWDAAAAKTIEVYRSVLAAPA
jgi:glycosyltransferase involved in cell wall biosynthesis